MPNYDKIVKLAEIFKVNPLYLQFGENQSLQYALENPTAQQNTLQEPPPTYGNQQSHSTLSLDQIAQLGITSQELIEFYQWKSQKAAAENKIAKHRIEKLKNNTVDATNK